jgi:hypothetical protein
MQSVSVYPTGQWFSPGTPVSSTSHNINEIIFESGVTEKLYHI